MLKAFEDGLACSGVLAVISPREDTCEGRCASITGTGCQGLCAMDPLVEIRTRHDGGLRTVTYGQVTPAMVDEIIQRHIIGGEVIEEWLVLTDEGPTEYDSFFAPQEKLTLRHVGLISPEDIDDYLEADGYQALYKVLSEMTPAEVRGRGHQVRPARPGRGRFLHRSQVELRRRGSLCRRGQVLHLQR